MSKGIPLKPAKESLTAYKSRLGIMQWSLRFCLETETLPIYIKWARALWPEMPYTDDEIREQLITACDLIARAVFENPTV
jgi:hypothetical protein